jgi:hypothetical protein
MSKRITRKDIQEAVADKQKVVFHKLPQAKEGENMYFVLGKTATNKVLAIICAQDFRVLSARVASKHEQLAKDYTPIVW